MSTWIAVAVIGLVSYLFRFGPIVALDRFSLPERLDRALGYAGPSAMVALTASAVVRQHDTAGGGATLAALLALGVGGWLAGRGRPLLAVVAVGSVTYAVAVAVAGAVTG